MRTALASALAFAAVASTGTTALPAQSQAAPIHESNERGLRTCSSLLVDGFGRSASSNLGLNAYNKEWLCDHFTKQPQLVSISTGTSALEFSPDGGESWLLTSMACASMNRFDAIRFKLSGPSSVYGIGAVTGGCKTGEERKQWYLPLQFNSQSTDANGEPTTVDILFSDLFPGEESVNLQWIAWEGFPPATTYRLHEVTLRGKANGCESDSDLVTGGSAWANVPYKADPGVVASLPPLPVGRRPYADLAPTYYRGACPDGAWALTFDDGPWKYTNDLLDILKENGIRATFFVNGDNKGHISDHVNVLRRAVSEGHHIGSHTWSHASLANLDEPGIIDEMQKVAKALKEYIGVYPTLMRPPYGAGWSDDRVRRVLGKLGYHVIMYGLDSLDFQVAQGDSTLKDSYEAIDGFFNFEGVNKAGVISLNHDVLPMTVYNMTQHIINLAKQNGYRFVQVDECVNHQDGQGWKPYSDTACLADGSGCL